MRLGLAAALEKLRCLPPPHITWLGPGSAETSVPPTAAVTDGTSPPVWGCHEIPCAPRGTLSTVPPRHAAWLPASSWLPFQAQKAAAPPLQHVGAGSRVGAGGSHSIPASLTTPGPIFTPEAAVPGPPAGEPLPSTPPPSGSDTGLAHLSPHMLPKTSLGSGSFPTPFGSSGACRELEPPVPLPSSRNTKPKTPSPAPQTRHSPGGTPAEHREEGTLQLWGCWRCCPIAGRAG